LADRAEPMLLCLADGLLVDAVERSGWPARPSVQGLELLYRATALLLYRMIFVLQVEGRGLISTADGRGFTQAVRCVLERNSARSRGLYGRVVRQLRRIVADGTVHTGPLVAGVLRGATKNVSAEWLAAARFLKRHRVPDAKLAEAVALWTVRHSGPPAGMPPLDLTLPSARLLGDIHERVMSLRLVVVGDRLRLRRSRSGRKATGSFYTPDIVVGQVVAETLGPMLRGRFRLLKDEAAGLDHDGAWPGQLLDRVLDFAVLDPAMGCGQFASHAVEFIAGAVAKWLDKSGLGRVLEAVRRREARARSATRSGDGAAGDCCCRTALRRLVLRRCIFGVDSDCMAVELARTCLSLQVAVPGLGGAVVDHHLRWGDSLVGQGGQADGGHDLPAKCGAARPFHWHLEFAEVFGRSGGCGFDAVIGNPPWISFSGRQRQPVVPELTRYWSQHYRGFAGWRSTQGLFLERAVSLVRPGGYVGLVLPARICDLDGYGPLRRAVGELARLPRPVTVIGEDCFAGVTEPAGIFLLVVRAKGPTRRGRRQDTWALASGGGGTSVRVAPALPGSIGRKLARFVPLPPEAFGDVGVHTGNSAGLLICDAPDGGRCAPIRQGRDIGRYHLSPARKWLRLEVRAGDGRYWRIGSLEVYRRARLVLRQTANRPIAARHADPSYFRNSVLAFFGVEGLDDDYVLAILNSRLAACAHRWGSGDAWQRSFPQVKVGHLRRLPVRQEPMGRLDAAARRRLDRLGREVDLIAKGRLAELKEPLGPVPAAVLQHLLAHMARSMTALVGRRQEAGGLDEAIDKVVYRLYGLTTDEVRLIDGLVRQ